MSRTWYHYPAGVKTVWPAGTIPHGDSILLADFLNQFVGWHRYLSGMVNGDTPAMVPDFVSPGDPIQSATFWNSLLFTPEDSLSVGYFSTTSKADASTEKAEVGYASIYSESEYTFTETEPYSEGDDLQSTLQQYLKKIRDRMDLCCIFFVSDFLQFADSSGDFVYQRNWDYSWNGVSWNKQINDPGSTMNGNAYNLLQASSSWEDFVSGGYSFYGISSFWSNFVAKQLIGAGDCDLSICLHETNSGGSEPWVDFFPPEYDPLEADKVRVWFHKEDMPETYSFGALGDMSYLPTRPTGAYSFVYNNMQLRAFVIPKDNLPSAYLPPT